jgi:hypothetical protein
VLDELTRRDPDTKAGAYLASVFESVIRFRTSNRLPTIITTNLDPGAEAEAYPRVASLLGSVQSRLRLDGEDNRVKRVRETNHALVKAKEQRPIR